MNISEYKIDTRKLRYYTGGMDEVFAELVGEAVEKFLSIGEPSPASPGGVASINEQTMEFLIDCNVLVKKNSIKQ